jgi:hypothetical protein
MFSVDKRHAAANDHQTKVLRLLEPQGEPDMIECDGRLYVLDKECEFIPEEFAISYVFDEQGNAKPVGKPSDDCERFYCSECGFDMGFRADAVTINADALNIDFELAEKVAAKVKPSLLDCLRYYWKMRKGGTK